MIPGSEVYNDSTGETIVMFSPWPCSSESQHACHSRIPICSCLSEMRRSQNCQSPPLAQRPCLTAVCLCRCPDLHTMVLFVASLAHTEFLEIFLRQCHDKLSSLQVRLFNTHPYCCTCSIF